MNRQDDNGKLMLIAQTGQGSQDQMPLPPPANHGGGVDTPVQRSELTNGGEPDTAVCLTPDGQVISSQGPVEALADATAYASRLAQLTAEALGMEMFVAMECSMDGASCIVYRSAGGELVALKTRDSGKLRMLREQLEL